MRGFRAKVHQRFGPRFVYSCAWAAPTDAARGAARTWPGRGPRCSSRRRR
jgi:hypothetical protein